MNVLGYYKIDISEEEAQEIENAYNSFLDEIKELSGRADIGAASKTISDITDSIIKALSSKNEGLLLYISRVFDKDYIFAHCLNVCLISVKIGLTLALDKRRLKDLGFMALTHAAEDMKLPKGILREKRDKESDAIMKLADIYDALTHPPAYRHATTSYDTLTSLVNSGESFDRRLIKILLRELSFYPKGSWVELASGEIGKVVKVNKELLLRPTVKVLIDSEGKAQKEAKTIDLAERSGLYIKRPLGKKEIDRVIK